MLLLEKIFKIINDSGLKYCIQNKYEMMPEEIPSDIDMMYIDADEEFLDSLVKKCAKETDLIITQKIVQGYYEYTYILSYACPKEYFQLQLDFYRAISRRNFLNIMPAEEMIENRRFYKCFYVPDFWVELKYMLIRRSIKHDMNEDHLVFISKYFETNSIAQEAVTRIKENFGNDVCLLVQEMVQKKDINVFYKHYAVFEQAARNISLKNANLPIRLNYQKFLWGTVFPKRVLNQCGMCVAFISPDGGGKSTIISRIKKTTAGSFYGYNEFYFRPHLLKNMGHYNPISPKEEAKSNPNPHDVKVNSLWKSFIRFMFYNIDFIIGYLRLILFIKIKKELAVFDRYYYDYYFDTKRYQLNIPKWMIRFCDIFIPEPDIVFVLTADAKVLYNRKPELTLSELEESLKALDELCDKRKNFIKVDVSKNIDEVTDFVTSQILSSLAHKTSKLFVDK